MLLDWLGGVGWLHLCGLAMVIGFGLKAGEFCFSLVLGGVVEFCNSFLNSQSKAKQQCGGRLGGEGEPQRERPTGRVRTPR